MRQPREVPVDNVFEPTLNEEHNTYLRELARRLG